jgi:hypothetical protein
MNKIKLLLLTISNVAVAQDIVFARKTIGKLISRNFWAVGIPTMDYVKPPNF